jgi:hypothetical protein
MKCTSRFAIAGLTAVITVAGTLAFAQQPPKDKSTPPKDASGQLPPGMSEADMKACEEAGKPGPQHAQLAKSIGVWSGKNTMWMSADAEPMKSESTTTVTAMMDGRFTKCETTGEMPGMGPFSGFGIQGFDNVAQKFQATWIDSCGTGIMNGTGELSSDGKTMTWLYTFNCPITKKQMTMREIDKWTGKDTKTMEMYMTDHNTGKEFKMMEIALTRKGGTASAAAPTN